MRHPVRFALAALAAGFLVSVAALAADPGSMGPRPHGDMDHRAFMDEIGLTEDQQGKIHDILRQHMEGPLGEQMHAFHTAHDALDVLIHDPSATDQQVTDSANAVAALGVKVALERHHMMGEIAALLTPEQIAKAREMHKTHHGPPHGGPEGMEGF